ncbi:MAG: hypothetical protein JRH01_14365 [Deltaproteobacteria bacterium]|nr:hypothetical protein [Deltaproteobacteria bacterium]MBW2418989.1 hypothetical protein [Deltaproteobacteria bacterium]
MKRTRRVAAWLFSISLAAGPAVAQEMYIFPNKGQSQAQQDKDRGECHVWAVNQTGFDPSTASTAAPRSTEATKGGVLRGGARGALGGAAIGAIAGNAGKGAAIGAAGGGMVGGMRRNDQRRQQDAAAQNWQAQQQANQNAYRRALGACLQGKGYTVN